MARFKFIQGTPRLTIVCSQIRRRYPMRHLLELYNTYCVLPETLAPLIRPIMTNVLELYQRSL